MHPIISFIIDPYEVHEVSPPQESERPIKLLRTYPIHFPASGVHRSDDAEAAARAGTDL